MCATKPSKRITESGVHAAWRPKRHNRCFKNCFGALLNVFNIVAVQKRPAGLPIRKTILDEPLQDCLLAWGGNVSRWYQIVTCSPTLPAPRSSNKNRCLSDTSARRFATLTFGRHVCDSAGRLSVSLSRLFWSRSRSLKRFRPALVCKLVLSATFTAGLSNVRVNQKCFRNWSKHHLYLTDRYKQAPAPSRSEGSAIRSCLSSAWTSGLHRVGA